MFNINKNRMVKNMKGFSVLRMMVWGIILGGGVLYVAAVLPIYNNYGKAQTTFDGIVKHSSDLSAQEIRQQLPDLLKIQYLQPEDLPQAFYNNLKITTDGNGSVKISSAYHVTAWFLGKPDQFHAAPNEAVTVANKWEHIRRQFKQEFDMKPHAESSHETP